jgi:ABC-type Fe3+/spermidine/putrescine transport system ATPase subunit
VPRDGVIAQYAAPADLYSDPADFEVARFISGASLLDGVDGHAPRQRGGAGLAPAAGAS